MRARARWLVLLAALLAFSWQSVVAETHWHSPAESASATVGAKQGGHGQPAPRHAPSDPSDTCPICRVLAHAAVYIPAAPVVFDAPRPAANLVPAATLFASPLPQRSHRWRSRAPPLLQA